MVRTHGKNEWAYQDMKMTIRSHLKDSLYRASRIQGGAYHGQDLGLTNEITGWSAFQSEPKANDKNRVSNSPVRILYSAGNKKMHNQPIICRKLNSFLHFVFFVSCVVKNQRLSAFISGHSSSPSSPFFVSAFRLFGFSAFPRFGVSTFRRFGVSSPIP